MGTSLQSQKFNTGSQYITAILPISKQAQEHYTSEQTLKIISWTTTKKKSIPKLELKNHLCVSSV